MNKKSEEIGRTTILMMVIILLIIIVMAAFYWQTKDVIIAYMDRIFS